ncbi:MAG TPA: Rieske 2Fe-2S domain-containing protein [Candidatus Binatia bacterium]|nr:Rieske 2Fe-2S domain-containing protein [Candidatus Binatia bacterium]
MHAVPRRRFIKGLFLGTAFSSVLGKSWSDIYAATFTPTSQDPTFRININDYPALNEELGSVRLGVNPVGPDDFPSGRYYPVIINRDTNGFYVMDSTCKHASCVVGTFNTGDFALRCPCHGSLYDIQGQVIEGPARQGLTPLDFSFDGNDTLTITVPEMGFNVSSFLPNAQPNPRLQLEFVAQGDVYYEVRFREKLTDPWQPISFSRTPTGPANEQLLLGDGDPNRLYVDRTTPTGFYAVSMVLEEV